MTRAGIGGQRAVEGLSCVVIVKNESRRLARCLESLRWAEEIVIVDDESTDDTTDIARRFTDAVFVRPSQGDFDTQRNYGAAQARGRWILQLDADEVVPSATAERIHAAVAAPDGAAAFQLERRNTVLGQEMRFGGWPGLHTKLYDKTRARYVGHHVHETLEVDGPVVRLEGYVEHYPFASIDECVERWNRYATYEARELERKHGRLKFGVVRRQLLVRPLKLFWKSYVKQRGYRDGQLGLVLAALRSGMHIVRWAKYWERTAAQDDDRA